MNLPLRGIAFLVVCGLQVTVADGLSPQARNKIIAGDVVRWEAVPLGQVIHEFARQLDLTLVPSSNLRNDFRKELIGYTASDCSWVDAFNAFLVANKLSLHKKGYHSYEVYRLPGPR